MVVEIRQHNGLCCGVLELDMRGQHTAAQFRLELGKKLAIFRLNSETHYSYHTRGKTIQVTAVVTPSHSTWVKQVLLDNDFFVIDRWPSNNANVELLAWEA